ncbi:MAG TPA: IgGFc-binding protein, partial [Myxococcota bacterium]|nr:IgGFc-binding protein [Myxococcota bacterium]
MRTHFILGWGLVAALAVVTTFGAGSCQCQRSTFCAGIACGSGEECNPDNGNCEPINCIPGYTRCAAGDSGGLERCNATGDGYITVGSCGPGQSCVTGTTGGTCDPPACAPGSSMCQADGSVSYCLVGVFENPVPCSSGEVCDPSAGGNCVPTECGPSTLYCAAGGGEVRMCNALGTSSTSVETCQPGDECNNGQCLSMCELAELERSFVGCVYMALDTDNVSRDDPLQYDIVVSNPSSSLTAMVNIETRNGAGGSWTSVASDSVAPSTIRIFALPDRHAEGSTIATALAYRVTASIPIVAYQFNSDDLSGSAGSSGASLLYPKPALDKYYYAVSLPATTGDDTLFTFGGEMHHSGFAVIGAFDGTNVNITVNTSTQAGGGIPAMSPGDGYATTLNEGDVLQIESANLGGDVTGSYITSDQPVAVFGYHECAILDASTCDHIEEELMPVTAWGKTFANVGIVAGSAAKVWRFVGSEDGTTVTVEYTGSVSGLPASGSGFLINAGEYMDFTVTGDFYAFSDKAIFIAQFNIGETDMVTSVPVDQWLDSYLFIAPPFFGDNMTIVRHMTSTITLDGAPIPAGMWGPA